VIEEPHRRGLCLLGLSSRDKIITSVCSISRCRGPGQRSRYSGLDDPGIESQWGGGGEIFRPRQDRPWGPLSPPNNGDRAFPGGKAAGTWIDHPLSSSVAVQDRVELYMYSHCGSSRRVLGRQLPFISRCRVLQAISNTIHATGMYCAPKYT